MRKGVVLSLWYFFLNKIGNDGYLSCFRVLVGFSLLLVDKHVSNLCQLSKKFHSTPLVVLTKEKGSSTMQN